MPETLSPEPPGTTVREVLRENLILSGFLLLGALALAILFVLVLILNRTARAVETQTELLREWNRSVAEIARWQGPTSSVTTTTFQGKPFDLGMMEARGPNDVEALVERTREGLLRVAKRDP